MHTSERPHELNRGKAFTDRKLLQARRGRHLSAQSLGHAGQLVPPPGRARMGPSAACRVEQVGDKLRDRFDHLAIVDCSIEAMEPEATNPIREGLRP